MEKVAWILRKCSFRLVTINGGYFIGMLLIRFGRILRKQYYKKKGTTSSIRQVRVLNSINMEVDLANYMGGCLFWFGMHHVNEIIYFNSILKPHFTFIDVGANQGEFSLFAATKLVNGKVISFEPVQKQLNLLRTNIELNRFNNIKVNSYGLSDKRGELPIYTSTNADSNFGVHEGLSSLFKSDSRNELEQLVSLKVFDEEYFETLKRFDVLKIDIEGAELYALKGMQKSLKKFKPVILIEINNETFTEAGYGTKDILDFFNQLGYTPFRIYRGNILKISYSDFEVWGNYIFKVI